MDQALPTANRQTFVGITLDSVENSPVHDMGIWQSSAPNTIPMLQSIHWINIHWTHLKVRREVNNVNISRKWSNSYHLVGSDTTCVFITCFGATKVWKHSHHSTSSPSCGVPTAILIPNTKPANKIFTIVEIETHSTFKMCGHQSLLLAVYVCTWLLRKYTFPSSQVTAYCFCSAARVFIFFFSPIRGGIHQCLITDTSGGVKW